MAHLIQTINQADHILEAAKRGLIAFLIATERLADLGCYNITPDSHALDGVTYTATHAHPTNGEK